MNLTDSRLAQAGNEKLELAMLSFFEQFRKIYIGDQVQKSSKVSHRWQSTLPPLASHTKLVMCIQAWIQKFPIKKLDSIVSLYMCVFFNWVMGKIADV